MQNSELKSDVHSEAKKVRLPGRQFAVDMTKQDIDQVSGGLQDVSFHPGNGTCTIGDYPGDDD